MVLSVKFIRKPRINRRCSACDRMIGPNPLFQFYGFAERGDKALCAVGAYRLRIQLDQLRPENRRRYHQTPRRRRSRSRPHTRAASMIKHPPLRYHGSKWRLAPWIISQFPTHRTYCEPFAGGAGVLLRKMPSEVEIYNDLDGRVVNFFRVARDHPAELMTQLLLTPYARAEAVACREPSANPVEDARRSCTASWQLFGGGQGQWHTGFRVQRANSANCTTTIWQRLPLQLPAVAASLRRVHIENLDALECIRRYDSPYNALLH